MVHALEQTKKLIRPGGRLIDIHPVQDWLLLQVRAADDLLLSEARTMTYSEDVAQADLALADVLARGVFEQEHTDQFDFFTYASSAAEMIEFWEALSPYDDSEGADELFEDSSQQLRFEQVMADVDHASMILHERVHIARLRPN